MASEAELDARAQDSFEYGSLTATRQVCADGGSRFPPIYSYIRNVTDEKEREQDGECRTVMEKVVQETFQPTPIPEDDILMETVNVRDHYDRMNDRIGRALGTEFDNAEALLAFFLQNYQANLDAIDSTDFAISLNGRRWEEQFDNATAADIGATIASIQLQNNMRQNEAIPHYDLAPVDQSVINQAYEACIRSGHEENSDPNNELSMGYCYSVGYEVGLRAFDELVAPMTPEQQRDLIQRQSERQVANR